MKLNFKAILFAAVAAFMSASCTEGSLELRRPGLENVDATKVELTTLVSSDAARVRPFYVYELTLSSGDGSVVLDAKFVSDGQPLHAATYSPAAFADAHKNTYVTGTDGTTLTVNGVKHQVVSGDLKVTADAGAYTVSGVVGVTDPETSVKSYYDLSWEAEPVAVKFKELPTMTTLTKVQSATSNVAMGTKSVTVQLATEDSAEYLAVDFYSEDGYLAAGTYKASAEGGVINPGEFGIGWDPGDLWNIGMEFKDWGTCWWTVADGAATAEKILSGEIYVAYNAKSKEYTIDIDNGTQYAKYVGTIPALTVPDPVKPGGYTGTLFTTLISSGVQAQYTQAVIQVATDGVTATMDPTTYQTTYSGTGKIFNLTIHAEGTDGTSPYIPTGQYNAADGTTEPFTWQITGGMPEYNFYWGTLVYDIVDGVPTMEQVTEGTIWVGAKNGEYIINYENGDTKFRYIGALTGLVTPADDDGGYVGEPEGGEEFNGVELTQFISFTDYKTQNGINLVGMELASDGITITQEEVSWGDYTWMQTTIGGSGNHIKIEFYSENGKLAPGTYTASADPASLQPGEFGTGYDYVSDWGTSIYGTTWTTYADGQIASQEKVEDGTAVVEEDGGTYTITLVSSTATARYIGPLQ